MEFYDKYVPELHANNVKIQMIGDYFQTTSEPPLMLSIRLSKNEE